MFTWLVRGLLVLGGTVASWFVAMDAPNFSVVEGVATMLLIALVVAALAFWPRHGIVRLNRPRRMRP